MLPRSKLPKNGAQFFAYVLQMMQEGDYSQTRVLDAEA